MASRGNRGTIRALAIVVVGAVVGAGVVLGAVGAVDVTVSITDDVVPRNGTEANSESDTASGLFSQDEVNETAVEMGIHKRINEIRQQRGLQPLAYHPTIAEAASLHSQDMAENDYFSHTSPDGDDFTDRYEAVGYSCRVAVSGSRYLTGAENIAKTYADTDIQIDGDTKNYDGNETQIARGIVTQWMNSASHRENILRSAWENEGIGIGVASENGKTAVYATQNFC